MIEFEKVQKVPASVAPGEDRIWFTSFGTGYVSDNQGHPIRFGAGSLEGDIVPVGTPEAANLIYFCTGNGKHYISSKEKWQELNLKSIPGTGGGPGTAGAVLVEDVANYYTSTDVEGVLSELGATFQHLLGKRQLVDLVGSVYDWDDPGERRLASGTTESPVALGWLNQRKDIDGTVYGTLVDSTGRLFTRADDNFFEMASKADLDAIVSETGGTIGELSKAKVNAGRGLTGGGPIANSPTLSLDENELIEIIKSAKLPFLRTSGGYTTGAIEIRGTMSRLDLLGIPDGSRDTPNPLRFWNSTAQMKSGLRDVANNTKLLEFDMNLGGFEMQTRKTSNGGFIGGNLTVKDVGQKGYQLEIDAKSKIDLARFTSTTGGLDLRSSDAYNYIQSAQADGSRNKNLIVSGPGNSELETIRLSANTTWHTGGVASRGGHYIGMDYDKYGKVDPLNKLYLFPYAHGSGSNATNRRYYTHMGYHQGDRTVYFRSYLKDISKPYTKYEERAVSVSATKFLSRSSEQYKDVLKEFDGDALEILRDVKAWHYNFKDDDNEKENVGFIVERGVPKLAVENDGTSIDTYAMLAYLWEAVRALDKEVQKLKGEA